MLYPDSIASILKFGNSFKDFFTLKNKCFSYVIDSTDYF